MPNLQFPQLDGISPTWADISVKCTLTDGPLFDIFDLKSLNTGGAVEIGIQKSGGRLNARGTGDVLYTCTAEFYRSGYQKFLRNAIQVAPRRGTRSLLSLVHFDLTVQHTPPGSIEIYEYRILGGRMAGFDMNGAEGSDLDVVTVPISVADILSIIDGQEISLL